MKQNINFVYKDSAVMEKIKSHVDKWKLILPDWLRTLTITYCNVRHSDGIVASVNTQFPYRMSELTVYKGFKDLEEDDQSRVILHEFIHVLMDGYTRVTLEMVEASVPEGAAKSILLKQLEEQEEGVVEDLSNGIADLLQ